MSNSYKASFSSSQLRAMSEEQISSLFHSYNWERIDTDTRLGLCQELENRLAEKDGVEARSVIAEKMNGSLYGEQRGDIIAINADMLSDGVFCTAYINENGKQVTSVHAVDAPNWNTYDTIVHEHTHGVRLDKDETPYTYISCKTDYDLYRIQDEERIAFANGNNMTKETIEKAEASMRLQDHQKEVYLQSIENDSYEKSLENAMLKYNDPYIDKTLASFINDRDNGINRENASPSYKRIEALYNEQLQRRFAEIMQSKEQSAEKISENTVVKEQNQIQEQPTEMTAQNEASENDGAVNEAANGGSFYYEDGADEEFANGMSETVNDGASAAEAEGIGHEQDGMSAENDGGMKFDDGSINSYDEDLMSSEYDGSMGFGG